jgi:hypothetical protein
MIQGTKRFAVYLWGICLGETLPVWATILGIIVGAALTAGSTFWIVPRLNESLEKQKIRTEFIIRNLDDLNSRTRALVIDIAELHSSVLRTNVVDSSAVQKSISKIAEMQWKAIELAVIFEGQNGGRIIRDYQKSLDDVRAALLNLKSKEDLVASQEAIQRFSSSTLSVIRELVGLGGLRLNSNVDAPKS